MIVWTMDPTIYGKGDYGLSWGTSREFTPTVGDKGQGRYLDYNATAPQPVTVTYGWYGSVLAQFREAWEDPARLAFGSNWFRMTLHDDTVRNFHFSQPFQTSLAGHDWWKVSMTLDLDPSKELVLG